MTFEHPAFLPLVLLPLVAYALYLREIKKRNSRIVHFTGTTMLETLSPKPRLDRTATVVGLAGVVLLALAQSGPGIVLKEDVSDNSIVLVIDVSGSMTATDVKKTRLDAAKNAATAFIANAPKEWTLSVVSYNETVSVPSYPTTDRTLSANAVRDLLAGGGTATGDALILAYAVGRAGDADRVQESVAAGANFADPKHTDVILISDGAQTAGNATMTQAAELAVELGVQVSTVALGTPEGEISILTPDGLTQILKVPPDFLTLQRLAQVTGGQFVSAYTEEEMGRLYTSVTSSLTRKPQTTDLTSHTIATGIVLLLAAYGIYAGRRSS